MILSQNNYQIIYICIVYFYLGIGLLYLKVEKRIPRLYAAIIIYFLFKMMTGYDKCTLSYIECKLRNVKKQDGYIYDFLHSIISLKHTQHCVYMYVISIIFILVYFFKHSFV